MAASTLASFVGAGRTPGLRVWRIESFELVPVDSAFVGQFFSGEFELKGGPRVQTA